MGIALLSRTGCCDSVLCRHVTCQGLVVVSDLSANIPPCVIHHQISVQHCTAVEIRQLSLDTSGRPEEKKNDNFIYPLLSMCCVQLKSLSGSPPSPTNSVATLSLRFLQTDRQLIFRLVNQWLVLIRRDGSNRRCRANANSEVSTPFPSSQGRGSAYCYYLGSGIGTQRSATGRISNRQLYRTPAHPCWSYFEFGEIRSPECRIPGRIRQFCGVHFATILVGTWTGL